MVYDKRTRNKTLLFLLYFCFLYFVGVLKETIFPCFPLPFFGYEMIKANWALRAALSFYHPYPTHARAIIVKYTMIACMLPLKGGDRIYNFS